MSTEAILLFEFGADGGGAEVFRHTDGTVTEEGSSGGMIDDVDEDGKPEDPVTTWRKVFPDFPAWWAGFEAQHGSHWICFYPLFIHPEVRGFIRERVLAYRSTEPHDPEFFEGRRETWLRELEGGWS